MHNKAEGSIDGKALGIRRHSRGLVFMTGKQFYDWQTSGGTDDVMKLVDCLERADVHGILMRVASLEDTLKGKIKAWSEPQRRQGKRLKDLAGIARPVEAHPSLVDMLCDDLKKQIQPSDKR
jgi:hypothetical protein